MRNRAYRGPKTYFWVNQSINQLTEISNNQVKKNLNWVLLRFTHEVLQQKVESKVRYNICTRLRCVSLFDDDDDDVYMYLENKKRSPSDCSVVIDSYKHNINSINVLCSAPVL